VESITRGVSSLRAGIIAGREPVARMMRSKSDFHRPSQPLKLAACRIFEGCASLNVSTCAASRVNPGSFNFVTTPSSTNAGADRSNPDPIAAGSTTIELALSWKEGVVTKLTGGLGVTLEAAQGRMTFKDAQPSKIRNTLRVSKAGRADESMTFDRIILATGSRPAIIPSQTRYFLVLWTPPSALDLSEVRERCWLWAALHRPGVGGHGVRRARRQTFPWSRCCLDCFPARPRPGYSSAQAPRKKVSTRFS